MRLLPKVSRVASISILALVSTLGVACSFTVPEPFGGEGGANGSATTAATSTTADGATTATAGSTTSTTTTTTTTASTTVQASSSSGSPCLGVDFQTDEDHCGGCNHPCNIDGFTGSTCEGGKCSPAYASPVDPMPALVGLTVDATSGARYLVTADSRVGRWLPGTPSPELVSSGLPSNAGHAIASIFGTSMLYAQVFGDGVYQKDWANGNAGVLLRQAAFPITFAATLGPKTFIGSAGCIRVADMAMPSDFLTCPGAPDDRLSVVRNELVMGQLFVHPWFNTESPIGTVTLGSDSWTPSTFSESPRALSGFGDVERSFASSADGSTLYYFYDNIVQGLQVRRAPVAGTPSLSFGTYAPYMEGGLLRAWEPLGFLRAGTEVYWFVFAMESARTVLRVYQSTDAVLTGAAPNGILYAEVSIVEPVNPGNPPATSFAFDGQSLFFLRGNQLARLPRPLP